jgi:hypothetical protein
MIRIDLYFSNWIILWSLLYIFSITNINPYIWCIFVLLVTSIGILIFIINEVKINIILLLIMVVLIPKILLIYFIRDCNNISNSFLCGLFLFIIYNIWLYINKTNIYIFYSNYLKIVLDNNKDKVETIRNLIIYNSNNYYN